MCYHFTLLTISLFFSYIHPPHTSHILAIKHLIFVIVWKLIYISVHKLLTGHLLYLYTFVWEKNDADNVHHILLYTINYTTPEIHTIKPIKCNINIYLSNQ